MTLPFLNLHELDWRKTVTVVVGPGPKEQEFTVHQDLLCQHSAFFRNAMKPSWRNNRDDRVILPSDDAESFSAYIQMLYCGPDAFHLNFPINWDSTADTAPLVVTMTRLWILADQLMDVNTKNAMVLEIYRMRYDLWRHPEHTGKAVEILYQNTPGPCGLRNLFVEALVYCHTKYPDLLNERPDVTKLVANMPLPNAFSRDIFASLMSRDSIGGVFEHGPPCTQCMGASESLHLHEERYQEKIIATEVKTPATSSTLAGSEDADNHCDCCGRLGRREEHDWTGGW